MRKAVGRILDDYGLMLKDLSDNGHGAYRLLCWGYGNNVLESDLRDGYDPVDVLGETLDKRLNKLWRYHSAGPNSISVDYDENRERQRGGLVYVDIELSWPH